MKWTTTLGKYAGIDVKVHATFLLLLAWVALITWRAEGSVEATLAGVAFILALFVCVVLHEFGHALTARRCGVETRDIILLPIGGVARLEQIPDKPRQELWIALAGPAVNVVIAAVIAAWLQLTGGWPTAAELAATGPSFLPRLLTVNLFLVFFNLLPAFPMDGGRALRALLGMRMDYAKATRIAASIGRTLAVGFGILGLFANPFLVLIAFFVWIGAGQEAKMMQMKSSLGGIPVGRVMITDYRTLAPSDTLDRAVELTLDGSQKDFPVVEGDRIAGVLTQGDLIKALDEGEPAGGRSHAAAVPDRLRRGRMTGSSRRSPSDLRTPAKTLSSRRSRGRSGRASVRIIEANIWVEHVMPEGPEIRPAAAIERKIDEDRSPPDLADHIDRLRDRSACRPGG